MLHIDPSEIRVTDPRAVRERMASAAAAFQQHKAALAQVSSVKQEDARRIFEEEQDRQLREAAEAAKLRSTLSKYRLAYSRMPSPNALDSFGEPVFMEGRRSVSQIIREVSISHGITVGQIKGIRRTMAIVAARMEACYKIACERPDLSYPQIARHMGGKDHTTILHSVRAYAERNNLPPVVRS